MLRRDILWIQKTTRPNNGLISEFKELCDLESEKDSDPALYRLRFDEPPIHAIVIDCDCDDEVLRNQTIDLLRIVREIDPDIPIFVLIETDSVELAYKAGSVKAHTKMRPHLLSRPKPAEALFEEIIKALKNRPSYDLGQRYLANDVAIQYDEIETDRPGTVAYWLFEEEIIEELVQIKEKQKAVPARGDSFLNILDIGCGTGRFAKAVLRVSRTARITCIDFSGRMLKMASENLDPDNCRFRRGVAEKLPEDFSDFDIVILGFGFPSYSPTRQVLEEARRVIAEDGWLFASVYNHNALAYDRWTEGDKDLQRPISTWIDRNEGVIEIRRGSQVDRVPARTFTPGQFARELKRADFGVGGYKTFPVLYSTLRCKEIESFASIERKAQMKYTRDAYNNKKFSHELWGVDKEVSASLRDRGFYATFLASPSVEDVVRVGNQLQFHKVDTLSP